MQWVFFLLSLILVILCRLLQSQYIKKINGADDTLYPSVGLTVKADWGTTGVMRGVYSVGLHSSLGGSFRTSVVGRRK